MQRMALLLLMLLAVTASAQSAEYYINQKHPAANDRNNGSRSAPWRSFASLAARSFQPGDTILVAEGHYHPVDTLKGPLRLRTDGKQDQPVIIKSTPAYAATLESPATAAALIEIEGSHIQLEGFRFLQLGAQGILIHGTAQRPARHIQIRNNLFFITRENDQSAVATGLRAEYTQGLVVENNQFLGQGETPRSAQSSAVYITHSRDGRLQSNDMEKLSHGIRLADGIRQFEISRNRLIGIDQAISLSAAEDQPVAQVSIANNVFSKNDLAISLLPDGGLLRHTDIYNNIFDSYRVAALQVAQPGMGKIQLWNNVFRRVSSDKRFIADIFTYDDPPLSLFKMDYNLYAKEPVMLTGLYSRNRKLLTLQQWQAFSDLDQHSKIRTVAFQDSDKKDFRLRRAALKGFRGRLKGSRNARSVAVGAYTRQIATIGMRRSSPAKTASKVVASSTVTKPQMAPPSSATSAPVSPSRPGAGLALKRLQWDVERRVTFNGQCVLESNRIDFYDGHDNTGLRFRMLNNELYLLTRSNIDMSFNDVGVQVGRNAFLHADRIFRDQNVVINSALPALISQLRKSGEARVQLRFWPTYPATKAYSQTVALDGFLPAYKAYMDCQRGE